MSYKQYKIAAKSHGKEFHKLMSESPVDCVASELPSSKSKEGKTIVVQR